MLSSTLIGEPFAALKVRGVALAPMVLVRAKDLFTPSNSSSKVFSFSISPNVQPPKLSLNTLSTVSLNDVNAAPADASVGIPA